MHSVKRGAQTVRQEIEKTYPASGDPSIFLDFSNKIKGISACKVTKIIFSIAFCEHGHI